MVLAWNQSNLPTAADRLLSGEICVIPTDTLYGTLALPKFAQKVYDLKGRNPDKPCIILISDLSQLQLFKVTPTQTQKEFLNKYWSGPVSVILPCKYSEFEYLHRDTDSLAFRLPDNDLLCQLINLTGPLIAPSANPEGQSPALNISEADKYFADKVGLYLDAGQLDNPPSTLVSLLNDSPQVLRGELLGISV